MPSASGRLFPPRPRRPYLLALLTRPRFSLYISTFYTPSLEGTLSACFFFLLSVSFSQPNLFSDPSQGLLHSPPSRTANLFLLISSILGSRTAGPHTQFVQWFMEECVDCLEQGSRGSILQFMPFTTVSARSGAGAGSAC